MITAFCSPAGTTSVFDHNILHVSRNERRFENVSQFFPKLLQYTFDKTKNIPQKLAKISNRVYSSSKCKKPSQKKNSFHTDKR